MPSLKFSKMHGLGNDFMVIDGINQRFTATKHQIRRWSDRQLGVGFDQLLLVQAAQSNEAVFKYRIFNADGGEVDQCGNGARCFARFVRENRMTDLDTIPVETNTGLIVLEIVDDGHVRVNMGIPQFDPELIPIDATRQTDRYQLEINGQTVTFSALAIGNPHIVIEVPDISQAPVESLGPELESHAFFPQRVNVGFVEYIDRNHFNLRVFERGVGETKACGSGACAAMVAGVQLGQLDSTATATLTGGELNLEWQGISKPVMMTGETAMVFQGEINYD